jgi:hypothetical protein
MLVTAAVKLRAGSISDKEVEVYRTGYVLLMNFVPNDQPLRAQETAQTVRAWKQSPTQSNEELSSVLQPFADNADLFTHRNSMDQGLALIREFDARLAELAFRRV